ncbi:MAG: hypothetical protein FWE74_05770 [Oscillospiraceae bacterium]|nr:hypothetical protein [Oscillospiraceae bacterium]
MTLKQYLSQAVKLDKVIDSSFNLLEHLKHFGLKSHSFRDVRNKNHSKPESQVERALIKIHKLEERLNEDIDRYVDLQEEIIGLINNLEDLEERALLERRYLLGQTWDKVAEECFMSLRSVHYIHNKALKKLEPFYNKIKEDNKNVS